MPMTVLGYSVVFALPAVGILLARTARGVNLSGNARRVEVVTFVGRPFPGGEARAASALGSHILFIPHHTRGLRARIPIFFVTHSLHPLSTDASETTYIK
ncbi:hypothetical protein EI94DRAFT_608799 [Lactarius quietus]|nr:hypothetical protein EI94DRAFT_608799 [Lactarius quietus]